MKNIYTTEELTTFKNELASPCANCDRNHACKFCALVKSLTKTGCHITATVFCRIERAIADSDRAFYMGGWQNLSFAMEERRNVFIASLEEVYNALMLAKLEEWQRVAPEVAAFMYALLKELCTQHNCMSYYFKYFGFSCEEDFGALPY